MEATLKFNLPDDQDMFDMAVNGTKWFSTVWDLDNFLRSQLKYNDKLTETEEKVYSEIRDKLHSILYEKSISLD